MQPDDPQAELAALRDENALLREQIREATAAFHTADYLRNLVARDQRADDEKRKRHWTGPMPTGVYETLEDIGILEGVVAALRRCWHQDDVRKACVEVSRVAWDLRKRMQDLERNR